MILSPAQQHNRKTSRYMQKRSFLERKLAQHEYAPYHPRTRRQHERMASIYQRELARLGAA